MVLNDQVSEWWKVLAVVPQGSIFRLLLFLIFINDAPAKLEYDEIFTDDTSLFFFWYVTQMKARQNLTET